MRSERGADIGWSLGWGALFAASPHTGSARLGVSLVGGGLVAALVYVTRRRSRAGAPAETVPTPLFRRDSFGPPVWALLAAVLLLFGPTLWWLWTEYTDAIWRNGHGLFVPVLLALLAAERLRGLPAGGAEGTAWGFVWLIGGAALAVVDAGVRSGLLASAGFVIALPGLSLLLLGTRRTLAIAAPLALAVFLIPLPAGMPEPLALPLATSLLAEPILEGLGYGVVRNGTVFVMREANFKVSTNCSGVATLYAATFFALLLATRVSGWGRRVLVFACIWPATIAVNALRVAFLFGMTESFGTRVIHSPIHGLSGIATFWLVMGVLYLVAGHPPLWRSRA